MDFGWIIGAVVLAVVGFFLDTAGRLNRAPRGMQGAGIGRPLSFVLYVLAVVCVVLAFV